MTSDVVSLLPPALLVLTGIIGLVLAVVLTALFGALFLYIGAAATVLLGAAALLSQT